MDIRVVIADVNPILRGWGNYFRTGNAAKKFRQADWYVVERLRGLMATARRPSTSFVLAALRALHADRLLAGGTGRHLSNDAHLHPTAR